MTKEFKHMAAALFVAYKALLFGETPVACLVVDNRNDAILLIGYNYTNVSLNGTRHAEFLALERLVDDGYDLSKCTLYVTVEPCIMCASYLRQIGIGRVVYGAGNDRFGGNGTVVLVNSNGHLPKQAYLSYGGICRTEGIQLLRNFYIQENDLAPTPQVKKNKDIDSKDLPDSNVVYDEAVFDDFYGVERQFLLEDRSCEITPLIGQGYRLIDLFLLSDALNIPFLQKELGSISQDQLDNFYELFRSVDGEGRVIMETSVKVYHSKKRPLED
ncbi:nucleoside deaminase [Kocuria palustris]|nr:nucleoside deaminase [Kocuria palustris]